MARWRKGSIVELKYDMPVYLKRGDIGKVIKSRKRPGIDAYYYDVNFGDGLVVSLNDWELARGRHKVRSKDKDGTWRCGVCNRKVKAPLPREHKTDKHGKPLSRGDVVSIWVRHWIFSLGFTKLFTDMLSGQE
jgi:hypothetical protein